ncbi:MAG: phytoene desaturase family protein [Oligosphaeraceae bacterium]
MEERSEAMEAVVVGGGPAGLAAALRLALCGKRVGLWERHDRLGGMNSWYLRKGITLDTGLHALTNLAPPQESAAPLNLLLRQLRIRRPELRLTPQVRSRISFPSGELLLTNDFPALVGQVQRLFPQEAQGFLALAEEMRRLGYGAAPTPDRSANALLERHIASPLLRDMLRLPVFFYGNPTPEDMEATAFATMFRSIFLEGLGRPMGGMRPFLETLETHLRRENVALHLGEGVRKILLDKQGRTRGILTDHGTTVEAPLVVSTIGAWETAALCPPGTCPTLAQCPPGEICFLEAIFTLPQPPAKYGFQDAVLFLCLQDEFSFAPTNHGEANALLVCAPGNYQGEDTSPEARLLRVSTLTEKTPWFSSSPEEYARQKALHVQALRKSLATAYPRMAQEALLLDAFTPKTLHHFTGHANGAIYGSPVKVPLDAPMPQGLRLAGTDQGLLGIVGAMLSGVLAANALARP